MLCNETGLLYAYACADNMCMEQPSLHYSRKAQGMMSYHSRADRPDISDFQVSQHWAVLQHCGHQAVLAGWWLAFPCFDGQPLQLRAYCCQHVINRPAERSSA